MKNRHSRAVFGAFASAALVGGVMVGMAAPASADDYTPGNSTPTVNITAVPATMQPAAEGGSATYTVEADVGDADTLLDLNTVTLCLYRTGVGDDTCATTDPQNTAKLVWTRATDTFAMTSGASTFWANDASVSNYVATAVSMSMDFKFKISEATLQGGWTAKVIAADGTATPEDTDAGITTNYYGNVDTNRATQSFGTIASGGSALKENISDGTLQVNGSTDIFYAVANFTDGTTTATNMQATSTDVAVPPTATKFAYDCKDAVTFGESGAFRVAGTATEIDSGVLSGGTAEGGSTATVASCRLSSGGQLPVASYSAAVTVTVAAAA